MVGSAFSGYTDPLAALAQDQSAQKSKLAQYAILQATGYIKDGQPEKALKEFERALAIDNQNTTARTYIGNINLQLGKNKEAIKAFTDWIRAQPNSVDARMALGNAYLQDKQYTEAESQFKYAARLEPRNPLPDYTLGIQYLMTDRLKEAETQFQKVQRMSPADGNVYYSLGALNNKQGKYDEAVKNLTTALNLKSNFPAADYELGIAYLKQGETDKAQSQLTKLQNAGSTLAQDLSFELNKPKMVSMDTANSGGFIEFLGSRTPVWYLDASLTTPGASKVFSVTFQFSNAMDASSITDPANWSISRANSTAAGYYNDMVRPSLKEASVAPSPISVSYDSINAQATIKFRIAQNATGDATIDPRHLVFKFSGKDALGRGMDSTADEVDGYKSGLPF